MAKVDRKKLLREQDEFLTFSEQAVKWAQDNSRIVLFVVAAAVIAVGSVVGFKAYLDHRDDQAALAMDQAFAQYAKTLQGGADEKQMQSAMDALKKVVEEYGATPAGLQARLALGSVLLETKNWGEAMSVFDKLRQDTDLPSELLPLAWAGLGSAMEGAGKHDGAADSFAAAAASAGSTLGVRYRLDQARNLEAAGNKGGAEGLYRRVLSDGPNRSEAQAAKAALVAMGLEPDSGQDTVKQ